MALEASRWAGAALLAPTARVGPPRREGAPRRLLAAAGRLVRALPPAGAPQHPRHAGAAVPWHGGVSARAHGRGRPPRAHVRSPPARAHCPEQHGRERALLRGGPPIPALLPEGPALPRGQPPHAAPAPARGRTPRPSGRGMLSRGDLESGAARLGGRLRFEATADASGRSRKTCAQRLLGRATCRGMSRRVSPQGHGENTREKGVQSSTTTVSGWLTSACRDMAAVMTCRPGLTLHRYSCG